MKRKPVKPSLGVTGVASLNEKLKKLAFSYHDFEGGKAPVVEIDDVIELLKDIKSRHPETVLVSSRKSLYCGMLKKDEYDQALEQYQQDMKAYKDAKKAQLLKQLKALEDDD